MSIRWASLTSSRRACPYIGVDRAREQERRKTLASMKAYQLNGYYHGVWHRDYDRWLDMIAGMYAGPGRAAMR